MHKNEQPHRIKIGAGLILVSVDGLAMDWGISEAGVESLMKMFKIPAIKLPEGPKRYINLWALETALFEASLPKGCYGSQKAVQAIHTSAAVVYATATKEAIRERLKMLQRSLSTPGPHTNKDRKKPGVKPKRGRPRGS